MMVAFVMFMEQCKHEPTQIPKKNAIVDTTKVVPQDTTKKVIPPPIGTGDSVCFNSQILPLVLSTCGMSGCHDAGSAKKGYILTNFSNIAPRVAVINSVTVKGSMPKNIAKWTAAQKALFQKWWAEGARDVECTTTVCDTSNVTYTTQIQPILQNYCMGCHTTSTASTSGGGVILDNYAAVKTAAQTGHLLCSIQWTGTCYQMPLSSAKLGNCEQRKFAIWANNSCPQ